MPIKKFRTVGDMSVPRWLPVGPELWAAMEYLGKMGEETIGHRFPPGVFKHRSIEDAERLRLTWEHDNVRRYQARLAALKP